VPPGAHLVRSNPRFLELLPDGVNKGTALWRCAGHLGIDVREIVCFGDDENDREMLENCGYAVAMGHAPDTVKAVADRVIGSNDGVALAAASMTSFSDRRRRPILTGTTRPPRSARSATKPKAAFSSSSIRRRAGPRP